MDRTGLHAKMALALNIEALAARYFIAPPLLNIRTEQEFLYAPSARQAQPALSDQ